MMWWMNILCLHAIALITKMGQPLEIVDSYYPVEKFRAAYEKTITHV
jgi:hypothetical protein